VNLAFTVLLYARKLLIISATVVDSGAMTLSGHFYRSILAVINLFRKFENCSVTHSKYMKEDLKLVHGCDLVG